MSDSQDKRPPGRPPMDPDGLRRRVRVTLYVTSAELLHLLKFDRRPSEAVHRIIAQSMSSARHDS